MWITTYKDESPNFDFWSYVCFSEFAEANVGKKLTNEEHEPENLLTEKGKRKSCPEYKVLPRL